MKTIMLSIAALTALSGVALADADDRAADYSAALQNALSSGVYADGASMTDTEAFAVVPTGGQDQSDFALRKLRGVNFDNDANDNR